VLAQDAPDELRIADIAFDELDALHGLAESGAEVVQHHYLLAPFAQLLYGMTADVACATSNQNCAFHRVLPNP
jgi:hypothetical protein